MENRVVFDKSYSDGQYKKTVKSSMNMKHDLVDNISKVIHWFIESLDQLDHCKW